MDEHDRTSPAWQRSQQPRAGIRWPSAARFLGACILALGLTGIVTADPAQASQPGRVLASTWTIEPTPNAAGADINVLSAVSCTSARACTAVGSYAKTPATPSVTLAERWNGRTWHIQPMPSPGTSDNLYGVSCTSPRACTAAGTTFSSATTLNTTLAETWNGRIWRVQPTPNGAGGSTFYAVSCTSARACTAVGVSGGAGGTTQRVLAEGWNGRTWRIQAITRPAKLSFFQGVSCATASHCMAVGYQNNGTGDAQPLAEAWNGKRWQALKEPLPHGAPGGAFQAVSCTSPRACTATGTSFSASAPTLAERWNGRTWLIQPTPNPANYRASFGEVALDGVSCASPTACVASGEYSPGGLAAYFAEAWNGTRWRLQSTPLPPGFRSGAILGVSCAAARCTAVGAWTGAGPQVTLAMAS